MIIPSHLTIPRENIKSGMPNISQADQRNELLKSNPVSHCAPVAVSNTLMYLARVYFKSHPTQLVESSSGELGDESQFRLIEELSKHMKTSSTEGTTPQELMDGLEKYLTDRHYQFEKREWKGWGNGEVSSLAPPPEVEWILKNTLDSSDVIFHLGWYKEGEDSTYPRFGGHFVTSAGYRKKPEVEEVELIVHDPAKRSEGIPANCDVVKIQDGILIGKKSATLAENYLKVTGIRVNTSRGADIAVMDGAFAFKVKRRT